jgi:hypothetical protein
MFYIVDAHGESLGKFKTREEANEALERLIERDPTAVDDCAIVEIDSSGKRVGKLSRHAIPA